MKFLTILAAFFAVASAINPAAIYRSQCSEGASYWCENAQHADECGAIDYCIQNAWRGKIVQESGVCQDCEVFVSAMDNILKQTSVQSEILDGAKMACAAMDSLADLCKTLVEELGPEVLQKLVTGLSDGEVCKVLQFCQEKRSLETENDSDLCTLCDELMAEANALVSNVTIQQDVENILLQICPYLGEIFPNCAQEIQDEFPTIIQYILAYLNPESCTLIGLCPGTMEYNDLLRQVKKLIKREGIDLCSQCMATMGAIDSLLSNAAIQETIRLELDQLCYTLGPATPVCLFVVNNYSKQIIMAIASYLNPNTFCTEFRFCPSDENDVRVEADFCSDCTTFVADIDGLLTNQTVQSMLITDVDAICALLGDFAAPCKSYVDQYAYIVFDTLASVLSPQEICTDLTFCSSTQPRSTKDGLARIFKAALQKKFSVGGPSKVCTDCEQFMSDVQAKLSDPTVQNDIVNAVEQVCTLFGPNADVCSDYVSQYGPEVIQFIVSSLDPDSVCNDLGFCMSMMRERVTGPSKVCLDCEQFMSDAQSKLNDPTVQSAIVTAVQSVCTLFGPNADMCQDYVSQYGPEIIQFIVSSLDPYSVCDDLGFCMSSAEPSFTKPVKKRVTGPSKVCTDCGQFFADVQNKLSDPTIQNEIVTAVEQVCTLFGPNADQCSDYVGQYGGLVIQFIISSLDPSSLCNDLGFCMSISHLRQKLSMLGDGCTDCKAFFTDISSMLVNQTVEDMITADLVAVCDDLGSFADQCKTYVTTYAPLVYSVIASAIDPDSICSLIQFCPAEQLPALPADDCSDCQTFFKDIDGLLTNQTVTNMLTADILVLCDQLGTYADECKSLVSQYAPIAYSLIASVLDPDSVCSLLQFCPSEMALIVKKPSVDNPELCTMCEEVVTSLETYIASQTNQALIIQGLDNLICANLGPLSATCQGIVKTYTPIVINLILSYAKPLTLCTEIKLCPGESSLEIPADPKFCADCKAFLGDIDALVGNTTFQNEVLAQLEGLCSMAGSLEAECKLLIQTYGPTIFTLLLSELDPTTDCTTLGLCPGTALPKLSFADPTLCSDCKSFLTDIDTLLSNQTLQNEVITELETLCSLVGSFQAECKLLVDTYGPAAFAYLLSQMDPTTACTKLGVCPGDSAPLLTQHQIALVPAVRAIQPMTSLLAAKPIPQKQTPIKLADTDCDFCKLIVGLFLPYVESNKTESEVLNIIGELCNVFSGDTAKECHNMVDVYGSLIFELLKNELNPEQVCEEIGQCTSLMASKPVKHLKQVLSRLPLKDDTLCTLCEIGIGELDTVLSSNKSKEEIKQEVEKLLCSNLPSPINTQCLSFMNIYGDVLIQLLIEQLVPSTFCADIGLCTSQKKQVLKHEKKAVQAGPDCIICEYIINYLDSTLTENSTEAEIEKAVETVCSVLPTTIRTECDTFIETYGPALITLLVNDIKPLAVCSALGLCSGGNVKKPLQAGPQCALCEFVVSELDSMLEENSTEAEIEQAVEKVCSFLPTTIKNECDALITEYGDAIIKYLVSEFNPQALCTAIGLCSTGKKFAVSQKTTIDDSADCVMCEFIMKELDGQLTENSTEKEIQDALDKVCSLLPSTIKTECDEFVNQYTPFIISFLLQEMSPEKFCTIIGLCQAPPKAKKTVTESSCVLCEFVMHELDELLEKNSTEAEIRSALDKVCSGLPRTVVKECDEFVAEYEPRLIDLLAKESTELVCRDLGLCNSSIAIRASPKAKKPLTESSCVLCEFVMSELDKLLEENSTQAEIKAALDKVCSGLPRTVVKECDEFVDEYEGQLIDLLAKENTSVICTKLGLCNGLKAVRSVKGTIECDLCQTAVREFMNAIQEPSVTKEVVLIVNDTCAILPDTLKAQCYMYVDQYGDLVTQFIAQFFDPITSCTLLEACPYPDNSPRPVKGLLGQHECTRGPGYWCASMENAKYCNMVEHCKRHAWN